MSEDCPHCVFEITEANCRGCFEGNHYKPKPIELVDELEETERGDAGFGSTGR